MQDAGGVRFRGTEVAGDDGGKSFAREEGLEEVGDGGTVFGGRRGERTLDRGSPFQKKKELKAKKD